VTTAGLDVSTDELGVLVEGLVPEEPFGAEALPSGLGAALATPPPIRTSHNAARHHGTPHVPQPPHEDSTACS
jgi:hypothetical protein